MKSLNFAPYYDDYDKKKGFYKIPFVPGRPVQARELTQLSSIYENQLKSFGDHFFKNGAMVIPGHSSYDLSYSFVKLESTLNNASIDLSSIDPDNIVNAGKDIFITGSISGIRAKVLKIVPAEGSDPTTVYIKYFDSGTDGLQKTFFIGDITASPAILAENIRKEGSFADLAKIKDSSTTPIGNGSAITIQSGVYYVDGIFVDVFDQTLILDKYTNIPSYRIGLEIKETLVTSFEDESLLNNAQGTTNYGAQGARNSGRLPEHRYRDSF